MDTDQIEKFGESYGVRNQGLLESAIAQPEAIFGGKFLHQSLFDQAAHPR